MKVTRCADGFQIELEGVLLSFRCFPDHPHGFGGNLMQQARDGTMTVVEFHGNHHGGVVCHEPKPYRMKKKEPE
jgi:hypothetical protein